MKKTRIPLVVILAFLITAISCESPRSPYYYTLEGQKSVLNYSTFRGQNIDSFLATPVIPVLDGDLIVCEDFILTASGGRDKTEIFSDTSGNVTPGGQIYALKISDIKNNLPVFSKKEMLQIGFLNVDEFPTEVQFKWLEDIAISNRNISIFYSDLQYDTTSDAYDQIFERLLTLFDPPVLGCELNENNAGILAKEGNLETLMVSKNDSTGFILPEISALKTLILIEDSMENDFLNNNPQLENLSIFSSNAVDTSIFSHLPKLRSLRFPFSGTLDLSPIRNLPKLDRLILEGDSIINVSALEDLKLLRWLHLPDETTQQQLDSVISVNQKLELLEINGGKNINNLSVLSKCKSLKGLAFHGDSMTSKKGLSKLTNLKYLSFPEDSYADSSYLALMQRQFPNTTIVPNSGVCLGSGWILILIPLVLIFKLVYRNKIVAT